MWMFSAEELAPSEDQGVIFGIVETSANATLDQTSHFTTAANQVFLNVPETEFTFLVTFATSGFGGMVVKPWDERERTVFQILPEVQGKSGAIPGIRMFPVTPPALPGGGQFPVEFIIASTADAQEILNIAQQVQEKATKSGMFAFPPLIDVKMDQPQTEILIDRHKAAALGLSLAQIGADLSAAVGGNFVNRFNIAGRSYKVIPQVQRASRLNPDQLEDIYVDRTGWPVIAAQRYRHPD